MKTTKEMIEVMQAYINGERIECKELDGKGDWSEIRDPFWDWSKCDYRVREKQFAPFNTAEEFLEAQREHGTILLNKCNKRYSSSVNCYGNVILINTFTYSEHEGTFEYIFKCFHFEDGTPCGKEVIDE